jgi:choline dehydrogenase-like flavoprotein
LCEVAVIGTGAGGAACAYELAKLGRAVVLVEGGHFWRRSDFVGRPIVSYKQLYLGLGSTIALGNVATPVWAGRGVGGSTTINSGTCYRAPRWTLDAWDREHDLASVTRELDPYYERVEAMLQVAEAPREHLGGVARVVARGAGLLGLSHRPLRRNAPGCDGQGVCCFGCPSGAKRSTDVSYVPEALKRGAQLLTGATVERIDVVDGRARGVRGRLSSGKRFDVRAEAVVVAGGALLTPLLLWRNGLCSESGWLGKNLSIHPATKVMALFDETIDMTRGIPQSYTIDSMHQEGLLFEGASTPLDVTAVAIPWVGKRFTEVIERYNNLATFGLMVKDTGRGRVLPGPGDLPLIRYDLNAKDTALMQRGIEVLTDVFLKAGARRVLPMVTGQDEIDDETGLAKLRARKLAPGDFEVTAFHPLGTCRMGGRAETSCVDPEGEAWGVRGLVVADGSAIPSSLGVNPQMTIMAIALRSAEALHARLDRLGAKAESHAEPSAAATATRTGTARPRGVHLTFAETMRGTYTRLDDPGARKRIEFSLRARSRGLADLARTRVLDVEGELSAEDFGDRCPVRGTLALDIPATGMLPYDFTFVAKNGERFRFVGQKRVRALAVVDTMTRLPARILAHDGTEVGLAEVFFDLAELPSFLWGWKLARG